MNIGLVVNARGKMCLVHDERFAGTPLWVGYHVEKRQLEIIFDTGGTYPIDWEATDEMDRYLLMINKILIIRMEDKKPVEGYDTSFVRLSHGRTVEGVGLRVDNGMIGDERQGQLVLRMGSIVQPDPPEEVTYDGLTRKLLFRWKDGTEYAIGMSDYDAHSTILRTSHLRITREPRKDAQGWSQPGFDVWRPIGLSMRGHTRPTDTSTIGTQSAPPAEEASQLAETTPPNPAPVSSAMIGTVKWFDAAKGYGFIAQRGTTAEIFVSLSEVIKAGLTNFSPGEVVYFELRTGAEGRQSAVNLRLVRAASSATEEVTPI